MDLVIGATGLVGSTIVRRLRESGRNVRAGIRGGALEPLSSSGKLVQRLSNFLGTSSRRLPPPGEIAAHGSEIAATAAKSDVAVRANQVLSSFRTRSQTKTLEGFAL